MPAIGDGGLLRVMRTVLIGFAAIVLLCALNSEAIIFKMVESAYNVTLVAACVPLVVGLYWTRATTQGALLSIATGLGTWMVLELSGTPEQVWPPQLVGFLVASLAVVMGPVVPQWIGRPVELVRPAGRPSPRYGRVTQAGCSHIRRRLKGAGSGLLGVCPGNPS